MGYNTYNRYAFTDTVAITASTTTTRAFQVPRFMGIGGVLQFFVKLTVLTGTPSITLTAKPIRVSSYPVNPGDTVPAASYDIVTGAADQTLTYWTGVADVSFSTIAMTTGGWYFVKVNMGNRPWDGVELSFANGAADSTGTITGDIVIG